MKGLLNVVSIHFTNKCNLNCSFCYVSKGKKTLDKKFFLGLPKYLKHITEQVALGGGEPTLFPDYIRDFSKNCKKEGLICNVTTNGREISNWNTSFIKEIFKDVTMVSISCDKEKMDNGGFDKFVKAIIKLKSCNVRLGCNVIVEKEFFNRGWLIVPSLFDIGIERVFLLYPKKFAGEDITKYGSAYQALSKRFKHLYVDDLTKKIIEEGYSWKTPCHWGKSILSIDYLANVYGCSFDPLEDKLLELEKPNDILKLKDIKTRRRYECPYLVKS